MSSVRRIALRFLGVGLTRDRAIASSVAVAVYVAAIVGANWMVAHLGESRDGSNHFIRVGFNLMAPSGVYLAAVAFPARDIFQRAGGRGLGLLAIVLGAGLSWLISSPVLAIASGITFLVAESVEFVLFALLQRRWFVTAILVSGCAGVILDSMIFLYLAGIPWSDALLGQIVGKLWVMMAAGPITFGLRRVPALRFAPG